MATLNRSYHTGYAGWGYSCFSSDSIFIRPWCFLPHPSQFIIPQSSRYWHYRAWDMDTTDTQTCLPTMPCCATLINCVSFHCRWCPPLLDSETWPPHSAILSLKTGIIRFNTMSDLLAQYSYWISLWHCYITVHKWVTFYTLPRKIYIRGSKHSWRDTRNQ